MPKPVIAILGAGSWGTAIAISAARNQPAWLWDHDETHCKTLAREQCNQRYLPGIALPDNLIINHCLQEVIEQADILCVAVPSYVFRELLVRIRRLSPKKLRIIWATKGLEPETGCLMHQVVAEELGTDTPMAVLSGPTFAKEVACGLPTAITLASTSPTLSRDVIRVLHSPAFRIYSNDDIVGVEYGGSIKNVLAIATGIADGLDFSANTRAALITRGLHEMMQIGLAMGGQSKTFMGLAGLGDLVLTCTDNQSRNRQFGMALAKGRSPEQAQKIIGQAVEGYRTAREIYNLITKLSLDSPIITQVYKVLYEQCTPQQAVAALLEREPKAE